MRKIRTIKGEGNALGALLQLLRTSAGLSATEVARSLGVTPAALGHWEHGDRLPSAPRLAQLAAAYDMQPALLHAVASHVRRLQPGRISVTIEVCVDWVDEYALEGTESKPLTFRIPRNDVR